MDLLVALGYFVSLAAAFLWKLFPVWNSAIPGGQEDTRLFLWNGWWFHHAISVLHTNPYYTSMLFHPFGANLISHDFPLWMNLVTHFGQNDGLSLIAASNLWFTASWILAGFCTYGLAREVTHQPAVALVAGTLVMTHSYTLARAMQNWGQFNLYCIALFLWCTLRARRVGSLASFILAGVALAWTAACHYYFLIYSVLIGVAVAAYDLSPYALRIARRSSSSRKARLRVLALAAVAGTIALAIRLHPGIYSIGALQISMLTWENPLLVMWILFIVWAATHFHLEILRRTLDRELGYKRLGHYLLFGGTTAIFLSPLFWESWKLIRLGGYPKQSILWKTHPLGANLLSLFSPNPLQALWGPAVSRWYLAHGMQPQEQAAAIGWVCLALIAASRVWKESAPGQVTSGAQYGQPLHPKGVGAAARAWLTLAIFATVLSMGTHLHIAQHNLWCPLPFFFFRLLPILGNVRMPERWMAVGAIAWAVTLSYAIIQLSIRRSWPVQKLAFMAVALILIENWPGVPYAAAPPAFPIYQRLRDLPAGAVLPVPIYIGDSSIGAGNAINNQFIFPWDHLWAQTIHEKPILGGYVGRISRRIINSYKEDPFIHRLLDVEEEKIQSIDPEPAYGEYAVRDLGIRYVLLYPGSTDPTTVKYVLGSLPLELIEREGPIELYRVKGYRSD